MKKSLIALAVLGAFAGAASAQSSVTLSGGVDAAIQRQNGDWNMSTGNSGRTAFTLSGREDLGGGMSAFFAFNYRFNAATGQSTSQPETGRFWRQSWVGLQGGFGDVRLGRMLPPLQEFNGGFDPFGTETVGSTHTGGINAGLAGSSRNNNAVYYRSPSLGGLQLHATIAAGDANAGQNCTSTSTTAIGLCTLRDGTERPMGIGAIYSAGPLRFAVAYDRNARDEKTTGIYGGFNAGFADLMFQWENGDVSATSDVTRWSLGARVPMGAATLKAGYTNWSDEEKKKLGLGLDYSLSKRTIVYTDVAKPSGDGFTSAQKKTQFDVGVWHRF